MKKLVFGLSLMVGSFTFAQVSPTFGLKAGINVASISKDGFDDTKSKVGFAGGAFVNVPIAEQFSIQPEVLYSQMGAKADRTIAGTTYSNELKLDYIAVPVMLQFKATPSFYLEAGPEFGFLVSAKNKLTAGNSSSTIDLGKDSFSSFNMGAALGLGYDITRNFGINARYVAGFTNINKKDANTNGDTTFQNNGSNRNNNFQAGVYFKF